MTLNESKREPPQWLNAEYYTRVLRSAYNNPELIIKSCDVDFATAPGDHYSSLIFRAKLEVVKKPAGEAENLSLVCKTFHTADVEDFMMEIFDREAEMLMKIMPVINEDLLMVMPEFQPLSAECIYHDGEPQCVLGLQDLKQLGFSLLDRHHGLNMKATTLAIQALAQFHAGSLKMLQKSPQLLQTFERNYWADPIRDFLPRMINSGLASLIEAASNWKDFPEEHFQKLKSLEGKMADKLMENARYNGRYLKVLQHGDCWVNNMMFKEEGSEYSDFRFVDFQMCGLNSAGIDLNYFIFTSPSADIRLKNIDEMLKVYYDTFLSMTEKINAEVPSSFTFEELKSDFTSRALFGFFATIIVYPITITEKKDVMDPLELIDTTDSTKRQYNTQTFRKILNLVFPYFDKCGVF